MRADDLPDSIKRLNPQIFARPQVVAREINEKREERGDMGKIPSAALPSKIDAKNAKLDNAPKLNKTETRFAREWLARYCAGFKECFVVPQPTRFFRLTGGGTYTPDFLVLHEEGASVFEVKMAGAHYAGWEQGYERYKRAALEFSRPWLSFVMATWQGKLNAWKIETWENQND